MTIGPTPRRIERRSPATAARPEPSTPTAAAVPGPPYLRTRDLAARLGIPAWRIRRLAAAGTIPSLRIHGGHYLFLTDALPAIAASLRRKPVPPHDRATETVRELAGGRLWTADTFASWRTCPSYSSPSTVWILGRHGFWVVSRRARFTLGAAAKILGRSTGSLRVVLHRQAVLFSKPVHQRLKGHPRLHRILTAADLDCLAVMYALNDWS